MSLARDQRRVVARIVGRIVARIVGWAAWA